MIFHQQLYLYLSDDLSKIKSYCDPGDPENSWKIRAQVELRKSNRM